MPDKTVADLIKEAQGEIANLTKDAKDTRDKIAEAEVARQATIEELKKAVGISSATVTDVEQKLARIATDVSGNVTKLQGLEDTINTLAKKVNRPGGPDLSNDEQARKAAIGLLELKHQFKVPKRDVEHPFQPTEDAISEALVAVKALNAVMNTTDTANLSAEYRKALSAFNMGASGFILAPEMSSRILSCIVDPTDVTGLFDNLTISGPSIKFLVDNVRIDQAAWACETNCFANNPQANLADLGEREIKPETLRYIICASRDILEDASINIENWMLGKVNFAFRNTISTAALTGDGSGKPMGILTPASGVPICDTAPATPAGQFTWQDLIMLKWNVPMQWHGGGKYLMNQNTFGLTLTMSDALGRPIMIATPQDNGSYMVNGSGVQVVTQMPDAVPGALPVAWGNWKAAYMIVNRKSVTMQQDPYSAGFCILYKFESRVGGGVICPNAARLLRIR